MADDIDLTATRELSHTLFGGAQYRIDVGAAIAESDGIVCAVDLVKLLGDPPGKSSVNTELKVLERARLLARTNVRTDRRVYLVRQDSPWWEMCRGLRDATAKKHVRRKRSTARAGVAATAPSSAVPQSGRR